MSDSPRAYAGHVAERWTSYTVNSTPLQDLRCSDVPVFVLQGDRDAASSIVSSDVFVLELMRQNPALPITYWMLPGVDHDLRAADGTSLKQRVLEAFFDFAQDPPSMHRFLLGVPARVIAEGPTPRRVRPEPCPAPR